MPLRGHVALMMEGQAWSLGHDQRPVSLPFRSLSNPASEDLDFGGLQLPVVFRGRHFLARVRGGESPDQLAFARLAQRDNLAAVAILENAPIGDVEPQVRFRVPWRQVRGNRSRRPRESARTCRWKSTVGGGISRQGNSVSAPRQLRQAGFPPWA